MYLDISNSFCCLFKLHWINDEIFIFANEFEILMLILNGKKNRDETKSSKEQKFWSVAIPIEQC